jgi:hypothetical protein
MGRRDRAEGAAYFGAGGEIRLHARFRDAAGRRQPYAAVTNLTNSAGGG